MSRRPEPLSETDFRRTALALCAGLIIGLACILAFEVFKPAIVGVLVAVAIGGGAP